MGIPVATVIGLTLASIGTGCPSRRNPFNVKLGGFGNQAARLLQRPPVVHAAREIRYKGGRCVRRSDTPDYLGASTIRSVAAASTALRLNGIGWYLPEDHSSSRSA